MNASVEISVSRMKIKKHLVSLFLYAFAGVMALIWITPVVWTFLTSLKSNAEIETVGFAFLPKAVTFQNYMDVINNSQNAPVLRWFFNSILVSTSNTILTLIVTSTAAYAFARLEFKGRNKLFWGLMSFIMFPAIINLIPLYALCNFLNWIDTPLALIVPTAANVFFVFLIRQFLIGIPKELDESAFIDGANEWQIFMKVIVPLSRPVLTVVALFAFTMSWNDFLFPSVVMNNVEHLTLTPGLQILQGVYEHKKGHIFAGAVLSMVPTLLIYLGAQKFFLEGLSLSSGIKD